VKHWFQDRGFFWWLRLDAIVVLVGFNFVLGLVRWGIEDTDWLTKFSALLVAGGSELGLGVALWLLSDELYGARKWYKLLLWGLGGLVVMLISLYVNYTYFSLKGETVQDLAIRAGLPMFFLLFFSMLPTKRRELTAAQIDERGQRELQKIQWQQRLQEAKDEPTRRALAEKEARKQEREREKAILLDMLAIAKDAGVDTERFYVDSGEGYEWNKRGLQRALEGLNLWPPDRETLGKAPADDAQFTRTLASLVDPVAAAEPTSEPTLETTPTTSGSRRTMLNAHEIAERWQAMGIPYSVSTIESWMEPRCKHPYALKNTRKFPPSNPRSRKAFERRASLDAISQIERKILGSRDAKVTPFPTRQLTREPAQEPTRQVTQGVAEEPTQASTQQNAYDLLAAE
jgi:hypothetical protein